MIRFLSTLSWGTDQQGLIPASCGVASAAVSHQGGAAGSPISRFTLVSVADAMDCEIRRLRLRTEDFSFFEGSGKGTVCTSSFSSNRPMMLSFLS